jgi:hypothetical protein
MAHGRLLKKAADQVGRVGRPLRVFALNGKLLPRQVSADLIQRLPIVGSFRSSRRWHSTASTLNLGPISLKSL